MIILTFFAAQLGVVFFSIIERKTRQLEKPSFSELALAYSLITTKLLFYATFICDIIAYINFSIAG